MGFNAPREDTPRHLILHGLGVEGIAALPWFLQHTNCPVTVIDTAEKTDLLPPHIKGDDRVSLSEESAFTPPEGDNSHTLYLRSPGIPPVNSVFTAIREAGIEHTTPTGYWLARHAPAGTITITGTKGKSSTASLTASLLRWGGIAAEEMGNIGRTPFEAAPKPGTVCVFELSSYMVHDLPQADIFHVVTSLYKEHTDWHGSHEAYAADKLRPFFFDPPASGLTTHAIDAHLKSRPDGVQYMEDIVPLRDGVIKIGRGKKIKPAKLNEAFKAPSMALALRAAIATCLARELLSPAQIHDALQENLAGWTGLKCRQQHVPTTDDRIWIDDALATVPEATLSALTRWPDAPIHLILGGKDRGQDFTDLVGTASDRRNIRLYVFDETGATINDLALQFNMADRLTHCDSLETAISSARMNSAPGDIILFSPAAPSSAVHGNYKVRSEIFTRKAGESR